MPMGLRWMPSCAHVIISKSSSKVPKPPGIAINTSASEAMRFLRSCIDSTKTTSPMPSPATSFGARARGMTPITAPPPSCTARATAPMMPTEPPPYTSPTPRSRIAAPSSCPAAMKAGDLPADDPQYTHARPMRRFMSKIASSRNTSTSGRSSAARATVLSLSMAAMSSSSELNFAMARMYPTTTRRSSAS
eukprot:Amastigsp_a842302_16.p2 type:complete len:191 gc:universal Amastigsp_a842302_16:366-938(+)